MRPDLLNDLYVALYAFGVAAVLAVLFWPTRNRDVINPLELEEEARRLVTGSRDISEEIEAIRRSLS